MSTLQLGDELFDRYAQRLVMEVTNPVLTMNRVRVLEPDADAERWILYEEIRARIDRGELEVRRKGNPQLPVYIDRNDPTTCKRKARRKKSATSTEDAYLSSVERDQRLVRLFKEHCKRFGLSVRAAYPEVRAQFEAEWPDEQFPSLATVYNKLKKDKHNAPLLKPNHLKGNRTARYSPEFEELICTVAESIFLVEGSRWTIADLLGECKRRAIAEGVLKPAAAAAVTRRFVRKVITTRLHAMPDVARLLTKDRAAQASVARHRIRIDGILQRVEQDAVHLPFTVRTPDGACSDVWLIHAIDCATSNIVGWHLKIGGTNESDGLRCIESTLFSKRSAFTHFGISGAQDVYGLPNLLVLDNGAEARGERFRRLAQLGVDIEYCKARHPQQKPYIERINRSLKEALQTLPGCTRMDGQDGQRDPVALGDDLMNLEELESWIVRWYFDKWANTTLDRFVEEEAYEDRNLGVTPGQRFKNIVERLGCAQPLPPNRDDWVRIKYHVVSRTLSMKSGITHQGYEFRGENLQRLITQFGETRVDVLYDPEDFRRVYVMVGDELVELVNQAAGDCTPALTFVEAKEKKAEIKSQHVETAKSAAFTEDVYKRSTQSGKKDGPQTRSPGRSAKKAVVEKTRYRQAVERAAQHPLPAAQPKKPGLNEPMSIRLEDVDELAPRDRRTGVLI